MVKNRKMPTVNDKMSPHECNSMQLDCYQLMAYQQPHTYTHDSLYTLHKQRQHRRHWLMAAPQLEFLSKSFLLLLLFYNLSLINYTLAAPQNSCILCDNNDRRAKEPHSKNYEEFLFEHQVSRQDAINALRLFNGTSMAENSCKSVTCTAKVMKYCLGPQFINDHCWCEMGHSEEGLPFVPHICYIGEEVHKPAAGSCFFYEEVKECCCAVPLAKQWRHISGASINAGSYRNLGSLVSITLLLFWRVTF